MFITRNSLLFQVKAINNLSLLNVFEDGLTNSFRQISTTKYLKENKNIDTMVEYGIKEEKTSKAMRAYLERSQAYNKFMAQEKEEYRTGKRHLANIMGKDPETFTQNDVNEAIEYLFPSGLFVKKTRPFLKPPEEVHPPKKEAEFDETGRPYNFLFYTGKSNFYSFLHKIVKSIKELNAFEDTIIRKQLKPDPTLALSIEGKQWLTKDQFESKFLEKLSMYEHRQLMSALERLVSHPFSYRVKDLISDAQFTFTNTSNVMVIPKPEKQEDGREFAVHYEAKRKSARANVIVRSPGTGLISINGQDLSYFKDIQSREQIPDNTQDHPQDMEDEDTEFDNTGETKNNAIDQANSSNPTAAANTINTESIRLPNLKNGGPSLAKKRKSIEVAQVQKRMDDAYGFLKQVANKPKSTKDESELFCDLLCVKLRALDEDTRANAMHDINNLMFNYRKPINAFSPLTVRL